MPAKFKLAISVLVAIAAIGGYLHQDGVGHTAQSFAALGLGVFMIIAVWLFPDTKKR